jgi:spore coat protein U-like protein
MSYQKLTLTLAAALLMPYQQAAEAATKTTTFQVTATVNSACSVSATDLAFGVYDPSAADDDNTSTITVTCTKGTAYNIGLDAGVAAGATVTSRKMKHDTLADLINYSLFSDASRIVNWGNTPSTDTVDVGSATGAAEQHTVYGRIATGQYVTAGDYSDTITVTISY